MSDNAETREALDGLTSDLAAILRALYDDDIPDAVHMNMVRRVARAKVRVDTLRAVLAALPPVAGPEVRPDETLRAAVQALCDEAEHDASIIVGVSIPRLRAALSDAGTDEGRTCWAAEALPCTCGGTSEDLCNLRNLGYTTEPETAPAPAPGDEGLR